MKTTSPHLAKLTAVVTTAGSAVADRKSAGAIHRRPRTPAVVVALLSDTPWPGDSGEAVRRARMSCTVSQAAMTGTNTSEVKL
jgi:hypothetical protein